MVCNMPDNENTSIGSPRTELVKPTMTVWINGIPFQATKVEVSSHPDTVIYNPPCLPES